MSATSLWGPRASWTRTFHTVMYTLLKVVPAKVELEWVRLTVELSPEKLSLEVKEPPIELVIEG